MAAKLQCEICGGKLVGKPGGIFECENCGTEYSTEWARAKIQEITGTVKVEGTVEVSGKVQVEGPVQVDSSANKEALLKRGYLSLEDEDWDKAEELFDQVLNMDAQNAEAYLGLAMAELNCENREELQKRYTKPGSNCRANKELARARQFGDEELKNWFKQLDRDAEEIEKQEKARVEEEERLAQAERQERIKKLAPKRERIAICQGLVAASGFHTVGLKTDGTVVATEYTGDFDLDECPSHVSGWNDIVAISAGNWHTVGLKSDRTVVAIGGSAVDHRCDVSGWKNIIAISAGDYHTVGLKADRTVVAVGNSSEPECDVSGWKDIVAISAGSYHTVGLKADGTVVAVGGNKSGQCDVSGWKDIVAISAGSYHTVGLKADGTVVATKYKGNPKYYEGQCDVSGWKDIVAISAGLHHTVGLKADGTVVATKYKGNPKYYEGQCDVSAWEDIVAVFADSNHTTGVKADGTVVAVGRNDSRQCDVSDWKLFESIDTLADERKAAKEKAEAERKAAEEERRLAAERAEAERKAKIEALNKEKNTLRVELASLKGLFTGKRRKEIEARLAQIETELKKLG